MSSFNSSFNIDAEIIGDKRLTKDFKIRGCISQHNFENISNSINALTTKYLCNCKQCLELNFSTWLKELQEVDMDKTEGEAKISKSVVSF